MLKKLRSATKKPAASALPRRNLLDHGGRLAQHSQAGGHVQEQHAPEQGELA
jgi:hypothetical protein